MKSKNRRDRVKRKAFGVLFVIGLLVFMYPTVSNIYSIYRSKNLILKYRESREKISTDVMEKNIDEAVRYNEELLSTGKFPVGRLQREKDEKYESLFDINGSGMMGSIDIPKLAVSLPIYHYSDDASLEMGVGHIHGSSLPVGSTGGHAVLIAHRGLPGSKMFSDLDELESGDMFYIHVYDLTLAYRVYETEVIRPDEIEKISFEEEKDLVTLVTCTPYGINTHRILVKGERCEYLGESTRANTFKKLEKTLDPFTMICAMILTFCYIRVIGGPGRKEKSVEGSDFEEKK